MIKSFNNKSLRLFLFLSLICGFATARAESYNIELWVQNAEHVVVQDAQGGKYTIYDGDNFLVLNDSQSPLTISGTDKGAPQEIFWDGNYIMNIKEPVQLPIDHDMVIKIWTKAVTTDALVTFNCAPEEVVVTCTGYDIDLTGFNRLPLQSRVDIQAAKGYEITSVNTSAGSMVEEANGVYSVMVEKNMTVNIFTQKYISQEGQIMVDVDVAENVTLTNGAGTIIPLTDGGNRFNVSRKQMPLYLKPNTGANITMCVLNGDFVFAEEDGTYILNFDPTNLTDIYVMTEKLVIDTFTVNVSDAENITLKDSEGTDYPLVNGENIIKFDFDNNDNQFTVTATADVTIQHVVVDNVEQTVENNSCTFNVYRASVVDIATVGNTDTGWITIVDEDFNAFSSGSNDEPDMNNPLLNQAGNFKDPSLLKPFHETCTRGWGGDKIYAAGGAVAMMNGFLNAPVGDYSGNLRMTFKARLVPGYNNSSKDIEALLIRDSQLIDYKRQTYSLTQEWQEFEFEANNGWFYDTRIQFFCGTDAYFEIDDVKIQHRITGIEPPEPEEPAEMKNNSFIARWITTPTADEYLLSVYEHGPSLDIYSVAEGFEKVESSENNEITKLPEGWEGFKCRLTEDPSFTGNSKNAISLSENGAYLVTPTSPYGIQEMNYTLGGTAAKNSSAVLAISALTDQGWMAWLIHPASYFGSNPGLALVDATNNLKQYGNIYAVKFEASIPEGENVTLCVDNINFTAPAPPSKIYLWEDKLIPGKDTDCCMVDDENFDSEADYWYSVKARNSSYTSNSGKEMEVFHAHYPTNLSVSDASEHDFTAKWDCGRKADRFELELIRTLTAEEDNDNVVVLSEDFSKVVSSASAEQPEIPEYNISNHPIDQYTHLPGWKAASVSICNGALGSMKVDADDPQGMVTTPQIDLSNDGGKAKVKIRAWLPAGEPLQVQGNSVTTYNVSQWPTTGWRDVTLALENCSATEKLSFWTGTGKPFLIDYVEISQNLKKGDKVDIFTDLIKVNDAAARSFRVEGVEHYGPYAYSCQVTALRVFHGDEGNVFASTGEERVNVEFDRSEIKSVASDASLYVTGVQGAIIVRTSESNPIKVYDMQGKLINGTVCQPGYNKISADKGIYVVVSAERKCKVIVR